MNMLDRILRARNEDNEQVAIEVMGLEELDRLMQSEAEAGIPDYYWAGPIIAIGTMKHDHLGGRGKNGLLSVIAAAIKGSRTDTLVRVVTRHTIYGDKIICAFAGGSVIPLATAQQIARDGYAARHRKPGGRSENS